MSTITLTKQNMSAVISFYGAEIKSLTKDGREYMWQGNPKFWGRTSPVLFPFVGQVAGGKYRYNGIEYPMGQHGFARDMNFELLEKTQNTCLFVLRSNDKTRDFYPLDFDLYIGYELFENGIEVKWQVSNPYEKTLEFSIGAHPAFNCDLNNTTIRLTKDGKAVTSFVNSIFGKGLLTGHKETIEIEDGLMELDSSSFDNDAFVIENSQVDRVDILDNGSNKVLSVKFSSPLVGIWSPPGKNAPFLCIEPWYGRADKEGFTGELNEREWNNTLLPGQTFKTSYMIEV